jgi:hypothetical protein
MIKSPTIRPEVHKAAAMLGKRSWQARLKKYGPKKMKKIFSDAGKKAAELGVSGRHLLPDDQVKPNTLYQRERRARLKAEAKEKKGGKQYGKRRKEPPRSFRAA